MPATLSTPLENALRLRTERSSHRLIDVMVLIGQIKNNQISRSVPVPRRGCRLKRSRKLSLYDVERSGRGFPRERKTQPNLSLCQNDVVTSHQFQKIGGARRDRTDDLMLAKHALSQLSYGPRRSFDASPKKWWARVDSNYRPHAYQACALTT